MTSSSSNPAWAGVTIAALTAAATTRLTTAIALAAVLLAASGTAAQEQQEPTLPSAAVSAAAGDPTLGLTVNQATFRPGDSLNVAVSVMNPGGGPVADFYLLIRLPDGATTVSIRLGAPAIFGTLGNLRSLAPVVGGVNLGGPFAVSQPLFQYAFSGNEPAGTYLVYFVALRSGALANGALDAGELLGLQTRTFAFTTQPGQATVAIDQAAVLLPQIGATRQLSVTATDGFGDPLGGPVTWHSTRPDQVTVDGTGLVRAVVANGSSQITASVGGVVSAPLLVIATAAAPGATLLTDAQIAGAPVETTPDAPPSADNTLRVVLRGVPPPAVGALLINTESQPVAGKVVAVSTAGTDTTVTLGLASLPELFPDLVVDEVIDLAQAPVEIDPEVAAAYTVVRNGNTFSFTPKAGDAAVSPSARGGAPRAGTRALFPFECESDVGLPIQLSAPPLFSVTVSPTLDVVYGPGGLQQFLVRAQPQVSFEGGIALTAAFEGKIKCKVDLFVFRVPVGGPLSMVIGGLVPVGVGFELGGKLTVATLAIGSKASVTTTATVGFLCPGGVCSFHRELGAPTLGYTPTLDAPSVGDVRLEPGLSVFGFLTASIGNPFFRSVRLDAFEAKIGGKFQASFAAPTSQMTDASYRSDYKVSLDAGATVGADLDGVARMLGLSSIAALNLAITTDLAQSPAPAAVGPVVASRTAFTVGDLVTVRVTLDPATLEFIPGQYNVAQVVLVRGPTSPTILGAVSAAPGQSEFTIPFTATGPGSADQLYAFVVTRLLNAAVFALEVGRAAGAGIVVSPPTTTIATGGTTTFTATVTGLASDQVTWTTDGGTISSTGVYTAPTIAGAFRVRATSTANPAVFGEAVVTVTAAPRPFVKTFSEARAGFTLAAGSQSVSSNIANSGLVTLPDRTVSDGGGSASMAGTGSSVTQEINGSAFDLVSAGQTVLTTGGTGVAAVETRTQADVDVRVSASCTVVATVDKAVSKPQNSVQFLAVVRGPGGEKVRMTAAGTASFACPPGEYNIQSIGSAVAGSSSSASYTYSLRLTIR